MSGTSTVDRNALQQALEWMREGDTLVVTRLDRLARSGKDLHAIIDQLQTKRVGFRCLQQGAVDTTTSMGKLVLGILGAVAEFETDIRKERQREGIEKAKKRGVYKGRPVSIDANMVRELKAAGLGGAAIAKKM
jgi:DNA invertase Pin-like site-specific DNA recombinase